VKNSYKQPKAKGINLDVRAPLPGGNPHTVVNGGALRVHVERTSADVKRVFAKFVPVAEPIDLNSSPPDDAWEVPQDGDSNNFIHEKIPVAAARITATDVANNKLAVWGTNEDGSSVTGSEEVEIEAIVPAQINGLIVGARQAIWFAWALRGFTGAPFGEADDQAGTYRPLPLIVPEEATITSVTVTTTTGEWNHQMSVAAHASDANGRAETEQHLSETHASGYKNATFRSDRITSGNYVLNRLVGLWGIDPTIDATEVQLGVGPTTKLVPFGTRPTKFFLAFHDGFEWSNNTGTVTVNVVWSA